MMRSLAALHSRRLGRTNVHVPIDLATIGVNDFTLETLGKCHRQPGLAHAGGANDEEEGC